MGLGDIGLRAMVALTVLLAVVSAGCLLKGGLRNRGLMATPAGKASPARAQALLVSVAAGILYLGEVLYGGAKILPSPSSTVTTLLGLSGGVYLGGKLAPGLVGGLLTQIVDFFTRRSTPTETDKA